MVADYTTSLARSCYLGVLFVCWRKGVESPEVFRGYFVQIMSANVQILAGPTKPLETKPGNDVLSLNDTHVENQDDVGWEMRNHEICKKMVPVRRVLASKLG